jgi:N-acetylglucosaminyl-diphospho-decaprenol L-rhamnosyltransferase
MDFLNSVNASITSHRHGEMVFRLAGGLLECQEVERVVVTQNISEYAALPPSKKIILKKNSQPMGYGANQNTAFSLAENTFFCILNPDIKIKSNPFPELLASFSNHKVALVAPKIITPEGRVEDSARKFPTLRSLVSKAAGGSNGTYPELNSSPDWVAGMFMLFRSDVFREIGGFDEKFFLYYEDVDICWRLRQKGYEIKLVPSVEVIHDARRESRKNWRYARWHLASMARYLIKAKAWW